MKTFILLFMLNLIGSSTYLHAAVPPVMDSVNQRANQDESTSQDKVSKKTQQETQPDPTLQNAYKYQKEHPEILYKHKSDNFEASFWIAFLLIWVTGVILAWKTALCRDLSYAPEGSGLKPVSERPYSFARMQLFWWTLIILSCYLSFYIYTGFLVALTPSAVILLAGGIGVSILGDTMNKAQMKENTNPVRLRHQDISNTEGWITDILSDEGGVSIHRFQCLVFNLIFGIAFVFIFRDNVWVEIFPFLEFETWQLTLLGASAAGYLGFKLNENSKETKNEREVEVVKDVLKKNKLSSNEFEVLNNEQNPSKEIKGVSNEFLKLVRKLENEGKIVHEQ
ncbi:hypothetical protein CLU96_3300 [Chryseobacterium sp. 52]|uniref:hypothetical protein n=1 Tax=Chryseobacterium sp. 52 TaxID=2035213 RepID=UPI000C48F0A5|nr:hypothetical protein [Chryseobacterium sp. 52]PIF46275.1 hypothetical protein CLU96_3300 [Chryseobacterium sp. 52]